ncbi:uncharacterized protein LOC107634237 [Arachis ipaensis]|uniref:uncharacterized protein LOC107634237 n=1 Tax=Arachis ipaensis TaxID=130454 RepID=UPI000A2B745B|nr:uncharacterized protein LOC107634237 [Arachis ipaensis]
MKATWDQANKTFWMLPPSFAVEHFMRHSLDKMNAAYIYRFMPVAPDLKFEEGDHWYLMVISLLDGKLYQFDSNLNDDQVEPRQEIMKSLVRYGNFWENSSLSSMSALASEPPAQNS